MIKRIPQNSILVELEKLSDNEYRFASGHKIIINTTYKPENFVRIYGTCVAIPDILTKGDLIKFDQEDPRHINSIIPEVKVGDKVYFTYIVLNKSNLLEWEGRSYYSINYQHILCVVRDKPIEIDIDSLTNYCTKNNLELKETLDKILNKEVVEGIDIVRQKEIIPIGGNVICDEYYGENAKPIEVEGRQIFGEISNSGLITSIIKKASQKEAIVRITGAPLKEDNQELKPGDIVCFPPKFGFKNNIEGKDYLFVKYWDIQAIIGKQ